MRLTGDKKTTKMTEHLGGSLYRPLLHFLLTLR
jgi:hypothetical protein